MYQPHYKNNDLDGQLIFKFTRHIQGVFRSPLKKSPYRNHFLRKWGVTAVKRDFLHLCSQNAAFFVQKWGIRAEKFLEQRVFQSSLRAIFLLSSILWKIFHSPR